LDGVYQVGIVGILGGIAGEVLHWYRLRTLPADRMPVYARSLFYWLITVFMILISGVVPCLYDTSEVNAILAFHLGMSTPIILRHFASSTPEI